MTNNSWISDYTEGMFRVLDLMFTIMLDIEDYDRYWELSAEWDDYFDRFDLLRELRDSDI